MDIVREQWEGVEQLPVSVADYLNNLYDKIDSMADIAGQLDKKAKQKSKQWFDRNARQRHFEEGELVLSLNFRRQSKLEAAYTGPYPIKNKISPVTYRLDVPGYGKKGKVVHVNLLKCWNTPTEKALAVAVIPECWEEDDGVVETLEYAEAHNRTLEKNLQMNRRLK